jgi:hypothetical protein
MSIMRILLTLVFVLLSLSNLRGQSISHIETTKNWYYIYDQNGKKIKTLSTGQGELKGYSSTVLHYQTRMTTNVLAGLS